VLAVRNLRKAYGRAFLAVDRVSFSVEPGQVNLTGSAASTVASAAISPQRATEGRQPPPPARRAC